MSENIIIGAKTAPFSWLPNYLVNNPNVSAEALAAALYLNGKPEGWRARPFDIRKRFGWGERIWYRVSRELKEIGLLIETITKDGSVLSFQLPAIEIEPTRRNVDPTKCRLDKMSGLNNKDSFTNKDLKTIEPICASDDAPVVSSGLTPKEQEELFKSIWNTYPVKKGRQKAFKAFLKAIKGKTREGAESVVTTIKRAISGMLQEDAWYKEANQHEKGGVFVPGLPHGGTFFHQERWNDTFENDPVKFLEMIREKQRSFKK